MTPTDIIAAARKAGRKSLDEAAAKALVAAYGIAAPRSRMVKDAAAAGQLSGLDGPLAVKVVSPDILHKSDVGGVRLGLADAKAAAAAIAEMARLPGIAGKHLDGWLVEEMIPKGVEVVIGGVRDPQFGPMVMVGLGGVLVEVLKDVAFRLCPITAADAAAMLDELSGRALLDGARGGVKASRQAIIDALVKVGSADGLLMRHTADIAELDLNPVIVGPDRLTMADARVILTDTTRHRAERSPRPRDELPVAERYRPLFEPGTVAVLGASTKDATLANTFIQRMRKFGSKAEIYPIHPQAAEIDGHKAYKSLAETPKLVDYAYVSVGAQRVPDLLAAANGRVHFAQVVSSGFSEVEEGKDLERDLLAKARAGGVRLIGPNCLGTYCPRGGLTFPDNASKEPGTIGIVSQSGGLTTNMIKRGQSRGLRFSGAVSVGNSVDVGPCELLEYYLEDAATRAIGCYIEDVKDGRAFFELLQAARTPKPVVLLRGGRTQQGRMAAASHTGALAGDGRAWQALTRQTPCVEVATLDEFIDALLAFQYLVPRADRPTRRVVMFGNGGGTSVLGADYFASLGLDVSPFPKDVVARLEKLELLPGSSVLNPIDTPVKTLQENAGLQARNILDIVYAHAAPDAIVLHLNMSSFAGRAGVDPIDNIFSFVEKAITDHPGAAHFLVAFRTDGDPALEERKRGTREKARAIGIPLYDEIPELAKALAAVAHVERHLASARRS